ncbi:MAG: hypothetical protein JWR03_2020, partial [Cohnella sp.]|nr:hypothetical protein [Cohnella sp.]
RLHIMQKGYPGQSSGITLLYWRNPAWSTDYPRISTLYARHRAPLRGYSAYLDPMCPPSSPVTRLFRVSPPYLPAIEPRYAAIPRISTYVPAMVPRYAAIPRISTMCARHRAPLRGYSAYLDHVCSQSSPVTRVGCLSSLQAKKLFNCPVGHANSFRLFHGLIRFLSQYENFDAPVFLSVRFRIILGDRASVRIAGHFELILAQPFDIDEIAKNRQCPACR